MLCVDKYQGDLGSESLEIPDKYVRTLYVTEL